MDAAKSAYNTSVVSCTCSASGIDVRMYYVGRGRDSLVQSVPVSLRARLGYPNGGQRLWYISIARISPYSASDTPWGAGLCIRVIKCGQAASCTLTQYPIHCVSYHHYILQVILL